MTDDDITADYEQLESGTLEWDRPINDNFEEISDDVKRLAARLDELERKLNDET